MAAAQRMTVAAVSRRKSAEPLVCLTAYDATMARRLAGHCDLLLVGDSVGMVVYGMTTTLGVTLEMMAAHGAAVARSAYRPCIVVDMPFGSYQESPQQAWRNAAYLMAETGCDAVKLEGGAVMAETVAFLTRRGIPVLGHVGLQPQSVRAYGGYARRGRSQAEAAAILEDGRAVAEAGAFALVVEGVTEPLARSLTEAVAVPTIGIGASPACDGQILVTEDMLGLSGEHRPPFVRNYGGDLAERLDQAVASYAGDVRARHFPGPDEVTPGEAGDPAAANKDGPTRDG